MKKLARKDKRRVAELSSIFQDIIKVYTKEIDTGQGFIPLQTTQLLPISD